MSSTGKHCPFLNRADPRCSDAFNIEKLDHAFEHCFGRYTACNVYMELLIERRVRRSGAVSVHQPSHAGGDSLIQVTVNRNVADADAKSPASGAGIPALPRV